MSLEVVDAFCEQYRALEPREIKIGWQGGEPTLMGLDFFRQAVQIEASHARPGDCFGNSLQTNGVVLDDEWCRFLAARHFLVGLSLDGPSELNRVRVFRNGKPAYERTMRALRLLRKHEVEYNILVVISQANVGEPGRVFEFLREHDIHFAQFIPCTEPAGAPREVSELSISAEQYADFMIGLFDAWVENDDPSYYVRRIDNWLHQFFGLPPECCEYREDCSNLVTVEWNGDVYPCDFFVEEQYRMGNVLEQILEQMLRGEPWRRFVADAETVPPMCEDCEWLSYCHAGCYRHRGKLGIGNREEPYLCRAKKRIFAHVLGTLQELKEKPIKPKLHGFLRNIDTDVKAGRVPGGAPAGQRPAPQGPPAARPGRRAPGRNDPCPCGSGRKFKHCCGRRVRASRP
jgi:uncharacterized protein